MNAELLGKHNAGWALFFAFSGASALVVCLWLIPVVVTMAVVVKLAKLGAARIYVIAAAVGALPFLLLR